MLDLFAGLEGWSGPWREAGHDVVSVDLDPRFGCTITADVFDLRAEQLVKRYGPFDVVLASPPCEAFSTLALGHHWTRDELGRPLPRTGHAWRSLGLVSATLSLIQAIGPAYFVIENPRAMLRKMPILARLERRTVTYCSFGERTMKPTDLWGGFPPSLELPAICRNGDPCHVAAPRGSRTGIQGSMGTGKGINSRELAAIRAKVPAGLSRAVMEACERDLAAGRRPVPVMLGL